MIDKQVRDYLLTQTELTSLIDLRLYTEIVPEKVTYPYVLMSRISNPQNFESRVYSPIYQFSCMGKTLSETDTILSVIKQKTVDYKGMFSDIEILNIIYMDLDRSYDEKKKDFESILEIKILHK